MAHQGDSSIEGRLIEDSLREHLHRVQLGHDLWPGIRGSLSRRKRARFRAFAIAVASAVAVSLLTMLVITRPWSMLDESMSDFSAVAEAYEGLFELETVRYRVDWDDIRGEQYVELHQVDLMNQIIYSARWSGRNTSGRRPTFESIEIEGKVYERSVFSDGNWAFSWETEEGDWEPFGKFGGLPWSREDAEDRFDVLELVGEAEIDGLPVVHFRATGEQKPTGRPQYWESTYGPETAPSLMFGTESGEPLTIAMSVHRGPDDYSVYHDIIDLWVASEDGMLFKVDWMRIEQAPDPPANFEDRDWCQGLEEFSDAQYFHRLGLGEEIDFQDYEVPAEYRLAKVICWNADRTEGRIVWGRSESEQLGEDSWLRRQYTFTAFNEPLELPEDLPE